MYDHSSFALYIHVVHLCIMNYSTCVNIIEIRRSWSGSEMFGTKFFNLELNKSLLWTCCGCLKPKESRDSPTPIRKHTGTSRSGSVKHDKKEKHFDTSSQLGYAESIDSGCNVSGILPSNGLYTYTLAKCPRLDFVWKQANYNTTEFVWTPDEIRLEATRL